MAELLVKDHAELDALFRDLLARLEAGDASGLLARLDRIWARLAVHIRAEHLRLFPALVEASGRSAAGETLSADVPTAEQVRDGAERLREDHDYFMRELARCVNTLRDAGGAPSGEQLGGVRRGVASVFARLGEHNRLEEEQVYLWQRALLGEDEREGLAALLRQEIENMPPRFDAGAPR